MNIVAQFRMLIVWWDWLQLAIIDPTVHIEGIEHLMDMLSLSIGLFFGIIIGCLVMYFGTEMLIKGKSVKLPKNRASALVLAVLVFSMMAHGVVSHAQTATPVPLDIPTGVIFTQTNSWMATFAPIAAIGIGISIALAVLGYLGKMIKGAFN